MALVVKNAPANAGDIREGSSIPGVGKRPFKESMATYSRENLLPRKSMDREAGRLQSIGSQRVRQNWSNVAHIACTHCACSTHIVRKPICLSQHEFPLSFFRICLYAQTLFGYLLWNEIFSALCSISKQSFSICKFLNTGETKSAIWKPSSTSSQGSSEELGRCERPPSTTFAFSFSKQGIGMWTIEKAGLGPDS